MSKKFKENNEAIENEVVDAVVDEAVAETKPVETEVKSFKRGTVTL